MKASVAAEFKRELLARGFTAESTAPNGSVWFDEGYFRDYELGELLEIMVAKRENAFRSVEVVRREAATAVYGDVNIVVEAAKSVIARLSLPADEA